MSKRLCAKALFKWQVFVKEMSLSNRASLHRKASSLKRVSFSEGAVLVEMLLVKFASSCCGEEKGTSCEKHLPLQLAGPFHGPPGVYFAFFPSPQVNSCRSAVKARSVSYTHLRAHETEADL
eukprot:1897985-Amphidinium_carterae.2